MDASAIGLTRMLVKNSLQAWWRRNQRIPGPKLPLTVELSLRNMDRLVLKAGSATWMNCLYFNKTNHIRSHCVVDQVRHRHDEHSITRVQGREAEGEASHIKERLEPT